MPRRALIVYVAVLAAATSAAAFLSSYTSCHHAKCLTPSPPRRPFALQSMTSDRVETATPLRNDTEVIWSYFYNLQRVKRLENPSKDVLLKPARSFLTYLQTHTRNLSEDNLDHALTQTAIQVIRVACSVNDYRLVLNLLENLQHYTHGRSVSNRIIGEAIRNLRQTSVSINKIKKVWTMIDLKTVTAQEVNAMLETLACHNKVKAALQLFRTHLMANQVDPYSVSILLQALINSITDNQQPNYEIRRVRNKHWKVILPSACWQWKEAVRLLNECSSVIALNNPIFSNLIRLDQRAKEVFPNEHTGHALACLQLMRGLDIAPDQQTCTLILGASHSWRSSLQLFRSMLQSSDDSNWQLPRPNVYCYSAVISACARGRQYETVMQLLDDLVHDRLVEANTYTYNGVLQSLVQGGKAKSKDRLVTALELLQQMEQGAQTAPDVVTFNTLLAVLANAELRPSDWDHVAELGYPSNAESLAEELLNQMSERRLVKTLMTYRHAIQAVGNHGPASVERMLARAQADRSIPRENQTDLMNAALEALASGGHDNAAFTCISKSVQSGLGAKPNGETITRVMDCLGRGNKSNLIPVLVRALDGDDDARQYFKDMNNSLETTWLPGLSEAVFSSAIKACLVGEDFLSCRELLTMMQKKGMQTSGLIMQDVAWSYAVASIKRSRESFESESLPLVTEQAYAKKASIIIDSLEDAPTKLAALVCRACCDAGLFEDAGRHLQYLHRSLLANNGALASIARDDDVLAALHRSLLKSCAAHGNVTAALLFCQDIQDLSLILAKKENIPRGNQSSDPITAQSVTQAESALAMQLPDWAYVIEAASKSGHWKVCLSTLQFVRPFAERFHFSKSIDLTQTHSMKEFRLLSNVLATAVKCISIRGQYAWAVRVIEDAIEWTGRRPPLAAAVETIRALSARGRAKEVVRLIATCLQSPPSSAADGNNYELILYVSAITAFTNEGLYAAADELFLTAVTKGSLAFSLDATVIEGEPCVTLDLHRMNLGVARSAVRIALQKHMFEITNDSRAAASDVVIITGRGLGSTLRMRPVLRPEVQRLLLEEFYPPLNTYSVPGNLGALRISYKDVRAWVDHQNAAKGAHMLTVAAALKSLASVERLRDLLAAKRAK